jgi:hypothetical protein
VRIYCLRPFDKFVFYCPNVDFDAYIDDLTVGTTGSRHQVQNSIIEGGTFLFKVVVDDLVCKIAMNKPALVGSSKPMLENIRSSFGALAGVPMVSTVNLGVDYSAGRARASHGKSSKRNTRMKAAILRAKRIKKLKGVHGHRTSRLFTTGIGPAAVYGAVVNGMSNMELIKLRRIAAAGMGPQARGRSLTMCMAINGDPTWRAGVAPIIRWA